MIRKGEQLCGRLVVEGPLGPELGSHLFGPALAAVDQETGQRFWLTIVSDELMDGSVGMSRLMAGAHELESLRHPELVRLALVDREERFAVIGFEELPRATSLASVAGAIADDQLLERARGTARALSHLHGQGLCHGLFGRQTLLAWERSMLAWQYGLLGLLELGRIRPHLGRIAGSEPVAPELERDDLTPRADVYGWGVAIAELATGSFGPEAIAAVRSDAPAPGLSDGLRELLRRCVDRDPKGRPENGSAILAELETIADGPGFTADDFDPVKLLDEKPARKPVKTESLKALAGAHAGDSVTRGKAFQSGSHPAVGEEPDLVALAGGGDQLDIDPSLGPSPMDSGAQLARIKLVKRPPAGDGTTDASWKPEESGITAIPSTGVVPTLRAPGPHGPSPRIMTMVLGVLAGVLTLGPAALALGPDPGSGREQNAAPGGGTTAAAGSEGADGTDGTGGADASGASESDAGGETGTGSGGAGAGDEPLVVPVPPEVPRDCPSGAVALSDELCMDAAEYPGLRRPPLVSVNLEEARELCARRKGRLCSKQEWTFACAGAKGRRRYPYGANLVHDRCNHASPAGYEMEVMPSGFYKKCVSPEGVYDLVGNVGEWITSGEAMGGDSATPAKVGTCKAVGKPPATERHTRLGFRCCYDR